MKYEITSMTLRQKIGHTIMINVYPDFIEAVIRDYGSIPEFLERYPIGGIFVAPEVIQNRTDRIDDVKRLIAAFVEAAPYPLLVAADAERGCGDGISGLTLLPHLMALGATDSEELAFEYGRVVGSEAHDIGIHWVFNPVADINYNPYNEITNVRALSDDPDRIIRLLSAYIKGLQSYNVAATLKHFPGDGVDWRNQHYTTTVNSLQREQWNNRHGKVFRALIETGVMSIMAGHISCPALQPEEESEFGRFLPATLSQSLLSNVLKDELGFNGVTVSDAVIMSGFMEWRNPQRMDLEVQSFAAGCDMMLWPQLSFFERMEKALSQGIVSKERLDDAVHRIMNMNKIVHNENTCSQESCDGPAIARHIAESSITLVRDRNNLLPLADVANKKILWVEMVSSEHLHEELKTFFDGVRMRGVEVDVVRSVPIGRPPEQTDMYDLVICVLAAENMDLRFPSLTARETTWAVCSFLPHKTIIISFSSPYYCNEYFEPASTAINAYSFSPVSQKAMISVLFGDIHAQGISPIVFPLSSGKKI